MFLLAEREQHPIHDFFLDRYPLVEELEVKLAQPDPRSIAWMLRDLGELLLEDGDEGPPNLWYHRRPVRGGFIVGFHAAVERHGVLRDRLSARIASSDSSSVTSLTTNDRSKEAFILSRLPFLVSEPLASNLLQGVMAACQFSIGYLSATSEEGLKAWGRILALIYAAQAGFDAIGCSDLTRSDYAIFHRNEIVRFLVLRSGESDDKAKEILQLLSERALTPATILADATETPIPRSVTEATAKLLKNWRRQVVAAWACALDAPTLDPLPTPFAPDARSLVLFQLLHSLAQALDLQPLEEAAAFEVMIRLKAPKKEIQPIVLTRPALEPELEPFLETAEEVPANHRALWMLLVQAGGGRGREFLNRFQRDAGEAYTRSAEVLELLRRHDLGVRRLETAATTLAEVRTIVGANEEDPLQLLLKRFYLGSEAYFHYCAGDLRLAEEILCRAGMCLERAIDCDSCLAPCAPLNSDIPLQRARIARRRNDWDAVARQLSRLAEFETGRRPLYQCSSGLLIDYDFLTHLCQASPDLSAEDRELIHQYISRERRIGRLNRWIRSFYASRGIFE